MRWNGRALLVAVRTAALSMTLLLGASSAAFAQGASVALRWDQNPEDDIAGYVIRYGMQPGTYTSEINVGNQTTWTVQGLTPHYRYYFVVHAYNQDGIRSAPSQEVNNEALILQTAGALPDAMPDVFWQHQTTGDLLTWHLNGASVVDTRGLSIPRVADTTWRITGTGDLNGDGQPDAVWRNRTTGQLVVWLIQNGQVLGTHYLSISAVADLNWVVRAVGDVDGDRRADLIWQHEITGALVVWFMNGSTVLRFQQMSIPQVADTNYKIAAAGDVNGDGRADIIWQNHATGQIVAWLLDGATVRQFSLLSLNAASDLNWKIQGMRDINGDRRADLIWRHATDGRIVIWYLNTFQVQSFGFFNIPSVYDQNWQMVGPS